MSCPVKVEKGKGLEVCTACANPILRVEAQVFLVVDDASAADFTGFDYKGEVGGYLQAYGLPADTGTPAVFRGSTTGVSYNSTSECSPAQVTWSGRPHCTNVDIGSLHK